MKTNVIVDKSFDFALEIIALYSILVEKKEYVLSKQLLRSRTSICANVEEAEAAISKREFIDKMSIFSKDAREWLLLLHRSKLVKSIDFTNHLKNVEELIRILTAIVKNSQKSIHSQKAP